MQKIPLTPDDLELVRIAIEAVKQPIAQINQGRSPAQVGTALRLDDGQVITALNLIADVGSISMCAEPQAIAQANRLTDRRVETIVAVYHLPGFEPKVIPPCGRCREVITDFLPKGYVILRDPGSEALYKTPALDLLPMKYGDYWRGDTLI